MLYIEKDSETKLPEKYHEINNVCAIIYDQITEIFVNENYEDLRSTKFEYDEENQILIDDLHNKKINIIDWLKENNLDDTISNFLEKHLTLSIASDAVNFIFEAISCAQRGKLTVAYALLRKPFTDELLLLEQILNDPDDFIERFFHSGNPKHYDPSSKKTDKKELIKNAVNNLNPKLIFRPDLIYNLRYNKETPGGLSGITNQALHIVTNDKNYKTLNQNLNFVFSNKEDIDRYFEHFYHFVPYLLLYTSSVIDSIVFKFLQDEKNQNLKYIKSFKRFIGIAKWTEFIAPNMDPSTDKIYDALIKKFKFECEKCEKKVDLQKIDFDLFFHTETFLCPKCFTNILDNVNSLEMVRNFINDLN